MKFRRLKILLIAACLLLMTGALVACRQKALTLDDLKEQGYTCEVIFDLAGGTSGTGDRIRTELHQYAQKNSPIVKPGENQFSGAAPVKEGYTLGGYYRGTKAEDGTIEYDLTQKWDFEKNKITEESLTLYAYWRENYRVVVHYGENYAATYSTVAAQDEDGAVLSVRRPSIPGYTAIAYYGTAEEATAKNENVAIEFPITPSDKLNETNKTWDIWADAIEGTYTVVRTPDEFKLAEGRNIYLLADIDFKDAETGVRQKVTFPSSYRGKFIGNNHKVSGFKVERTSASRGDDNLGLFNKLAEDAVIQDVTFADFELEITTRSKNYEYEIGALAGYASAGATVKNVTLEGTLYYTLADESAENIEAISPFIGFEEEGVVTDGCAYGEVVITKKTASE